jgi:hypothetical protein
MRAADGAAHPALQKFELRRIAKTDRDVVICQRFAKPLNRGFGIEAKECGFGPRSVNSVRLHHRCALNDTNTFSNVYDNVEQLDREPSVVNRIELPVIEPIHVLGEVATVRGVQPLEIRGRQAVRVFGTAMRFARIRRNAPERFPAFVLRVV